ncbi:MAG: efflux RND transporter periplasmic adaptor subunit [Bryobacteraceae bacterium]
MSLNPKKAVGFLLIAGLCAFAGLRIRNVYETKADPKAGKKGGPAVRVVSVSVDRATLGAIKEEILLTGSLKAKEQVDVTPKAAGRVEKLLVQVGDAVKQGDLIAVLEDAELQQQVNRAVAAQAVAKASSAQRKAELKNAQADSQRAEVLFKSGLIPRQEMESRQTAFQVVQAQVQLAAAQEQQAEAEMNELKIRLAQTRIYSPMDGHVARRFVDVGALVAPSNPIVNLVNLSTMVTLANVPEREVGKLRVGNQATVTMDAFGEQKYFGRVARISPVLDAATRSAMVEVEVPNPDGALKAEMFARVMLDLASTRQAVTIPREALVYRGQQPGVYVLQGDRPVFRNVETGMTQGREVEITANLEAGTTIVSRGASMLGEGDRIRIADGAENAQGAEKSKKRLRAAEDVASNPVSAN